MRDSKSLKSLKKIVSGNFMVILKKKVLYFKDFVGNVEYKQMMGSGTGLDNTVFISNGRENLLLSFSQVQVDDNTIKEKVNMNTFKEVLNRPLLFFREFRTIENDISVLRKYVDEKYSIEVEDFQTFADFLQMPENMKNLEVVRKINYKYSEWS